jgi:N-acyl-D-aspartate/D-glutamate deacylase
VSGVLFRGATVYDGSGSPGRQQDVAVVYGRIAALGEAAAGLSVERTLDAGGLALAPGFIDMHSHADHTLPAFPRATNSLSQGVTTELVGLCGFSPAPVSADPERAAALRDLVHGIGPDLDWSWRTFGEFLDRLEAAQPAVNVAPLVGHHALRIMAMGMADRAPGADELATMRAELASALAVGAWGMSTGLVYAPGTFAQLDELIAVGQELNPGRADALYVSHIRNEADTLFEAVDEALTIGEQLRIRTQVSHLKATGRRNAGKVVGAVERIQSARARGVRAHCDVYPYTAGSTFLHQVLPPWVKVGGLDQMVERLRVPEQRQRVRHDVEHGLPGWASHVDAAGGWHNILVASSPERRSAEGRRVAELAEEAGVDPLDYALDLLLADRGATVMIAFSMDEADVREALSCPVAAIGSDQLGVTSPSARVHPRAYGTFARVVGWGVREARLFTLEEAVRRMTGLPAAILGLADRGRVAEGAIADLVLFDPTTVADQATYADPNRPARGVEHVLVGGEFALESGQVVRADLGRVLRRGA